MLVAGLLASRMARGWVFFHPMFISTPVHSTLTPRFAQSHFAFFTKLYPVLRKRSINIISSFANKRSVFSQTLTCSVSKNSESVSVPSNHSKMCFSQFQFSVGSLRSERVDYFSRPSRNDRLIHFHYEFLFIPCFGSVD